MYDLNVANFQDVEISRTRRDIATSGYKLASKNLSARSLVKVGARAVYHARRWYVHIASAFSLARYYSILFA
jgi:predicted membrane-bound spermidine synthase